MMIIIIVMMVVDLSTLHKEQLCKAASVFVCLYLSKRHMMPSSFTVQSHHMDAAEAQLHSAEEMALLVYIVSK